MVEITKKKKDVERFVKLSEERKKVLAMSPEKARDAILDAPQPAALVHSFPEEDFYFLMHDIGIEDSLELLSLASNRQWEYILDIEVWEKDKIELHSVTRWLDLLFKVDPERFIQWLLKDKTNFAEFYLLKNIEVKIRESDQDPSEFGQEFFTFDETIYVRLRQDVFDLGPKKTESDEIIKEHRDAFLLNFFKNLAKYDFITFQKVLLESSSIIPAEAEEEAYRARNVRLAEKGFMPFEEAVGIYQPLKPRDFEKLSVKYTTADTDRQLFLPVPLLPFGMLQDESLFAGALKMIEIDEIRQQVQMEFAGLCNQIGIADQKTIREREALQDIVKKVCGYLNVGIEHLAIKDKTVDLNRATGLLQKYPLSGIFRVGYGLALELKWRVERWRQTSWFENQGLLLSFWGAEWMGVLGGLLIKKPLFYDNYETGLLYREFVSTDDIKKTENVVNQVVAIDELLALMNVELVPISDGLLTYKNLLLTLWARHYLGLAEDPSPLALDEFKRIFDDLWAAKDKPRKTSLAIKESFLNWLSDQSGLANYEISQKLVQSLENLFSEIEGELGSVASKDLDPRFIQLFLIE